MRLPHTVVHVQTLNCIKWAQHAWLIGLEICWLSLQRKGKLEIVFNKTQGIWVSVGVRLMHEMNIVWPACSPVNSWTSNTQQWFPILVMIPHDPLQTPSLALRFHRIITRHPILSVSIARGRLEQLIKLRYSTGYIRIPSCPSPWLFGMKSALWKTLGLPGNFSRIVLLISSTSSFWLQRMVCSE